MIYFTTAFIIFLFISHQSAWLAWLKTLFAKHPFSYYIQFQFSLLFVACNHHREMYWLAHVSHPCTHYIIYILFYLPLPSSWAMLSSLHQSLLCSAAPCVWRAKSHPQKSWVEGSWRCRIIPAHFDSCLLHTTAVCTCSNLSGLHGLISLYAQTEAVIQPQEMSLMKTTKFKGGCRPFSQFQTYTRTRTQTQTHTHAVHKIRPQEGT